MRRMEGEARHTQGREAADTHDKDREMLKTIGPADTPQGMRYATEVVCFSIWDRQEARQPWLRY